MPSFVERIRARKFASVSSRALDIGAATDTEARFAIEAGGRHLWGDGTTANTFDINLYRSTDATLDLDLPSQAASVTLKVGQSVYQYVKNTTGSTIAKGKPVRLIGSQGQRALVALSSADSEAGSSKTLGITAESIANNHSGFVITEGLLTGLDTSSLTEGSLIWLGATAGSMTSTAPVTPNHLVLLGICVVSGSGTSGSILVKVQNGFELGELHDVLITSPQTDDILVYNGSYWTNASASASSVTVSDTAPVSPESGDLWYKSDSAVMLVFYDSTWVEVGAPVYNNGFDGGSA